MHITQQLAAKMHIRQTACRKWTIYRFRMVKAVQAGQIKQIMQIKQDKCRSSGSYRRDADQAGQVTFEVMNGKSS